MKNQDQYYENFIKCDTSLCNNKTLQYIHLNLLSKKIKTAYSIKYYLQLGKLYARCKSYAVTFPCNIIIVYSPRNCDIDILKC